MGVYDGNPKGPKFKIKALGDEIDKGKFKSAKGAEYFYGRPPYQYTQLQPNSWGTIISKGESHDERNS